MTLVTDAMMQAVRDIGHQGLETTVTIMRRSVIPGTEGYDDKEEWVDVGDFIAWVRQNDRGPVLHDDNSGSMASVGRYRIHFKQTVELYEGDLIVDGAEQYVVNATNRGETYRVFSTATARKRD
jgi:hypothetical protein